jgi:hypothetical protein
MDHTQFKASQTAAQYVADDLDEHTQEAFELHLMQCADCIADVESWQVIKQAMPRQPATARPLVATRRFPAVTDWRMAASLLGAGVVGASGGWVAKSGQTAELDSTHTVVFNLPAVTRGADECVTLRLATDTHVAVLRVPGVARDLRLVALDAQQHPLPDSQYAARIQPDGSRLLRIESQLLRGHAVQLEALHPDGQSEPLSCVTGEVATE